MIDAPRTDRPLRREPASPLVVALVAVAALAAGAIVMKETKKLAASGVHAPVAGASWYEGARGFADADAERKKTGAPMVVYFHTDWCGWCRKLESDYLASKEGADFLRGVLRVRVNPEEGSDENALAAEFGVRGFPAFFVVSADGGSKRRVHPFTTEGFMSPAQFVEACRAAE
jgi:thiol:disulfide interchange protein